MCGYLRRRINFIPDIRASVCISLVLGLAVTQHRLRDRFNRADLIIIFQEIVYENAIGNRADL